MKVEHAAPSSPLLTSPPVAGGISALSLVAALGLLVGLGASTVDVPPAVSLVLFLSLLAVSIALNGAIGGEVARRKELQRDLRAAQRIQRALIPSSLMPPPGLDMAVWCRPSRELGGDCVDLVTGPDGRCWLFVGDVSGKGIASAIVMSNVQAQFRTLAKAGLPIGEVARHIDEQLAGHATSHYVTGVLLLFDPGAATLEFLNAGHVPPVLMMAGGEPGALQPTGPPLGLLPGTPSDTVRMPLAAPCALVLFTDGLTERRNADGVEYGTDRVGAVVRGAPHGIAASELVRLVVADNEAFGAGVPEDDLTVVAVQVAGRGVESGRGSASGYDTLSPGLGSQWAAPEGA